MNSLQIRKHTITAIRSAKELSGIGPAQWRILEINNGDFELQFIYSDDPVADLWLPVVTRDGQSKVYKSLKAVFGDITRIASDAVVHYHGSQ